MSIFADRLKTAMQQAQISSAQLSKQTGIGRSSISQWLSSKYVAKYDKVVTLATALAVDPEWLSGATDEPTAVQQSVADTEVDAQLVSLWQQLDAAGQQKLLNKAQKLVAKLDQPDAKRKKKGKKKKNKKRKKTRV